jgi:hypothetical protein
MTEMEARMSRRKGNSYLGGHSLMRDPSWSRKLAGRIRKTRQHQERVERAQQQLAAERAAYEQRRRSEIVKPEQVRRSKPQKPMRATPWGPSPNYYPKRGPKR